MPHHRPGPPPAGAGAPSQAHHPPDRTAPRASQAHGGPMPGPGLRTTTGAMPHHRPGLPPAGAEAPSQAHHPPDRTAPRASQAHGGPMPGPGLCTTTGAMPHHRPGLPPAGAEAPSQAHHPPDRTAPRASQAHGGAHAWAWTAAHDGGHKVSPLSPPRGGLSPPLSGDRFIITNQMLTRFFRICPHCPREKLGHTHGGPFKGTPGRSPPRVVRGLFVR
jgi:hypothetical protein